jgi:hypothetical protein
MPYPLASVWLPHLLACLLNENFETLPYGNGSYARMGDYA